MQLSAARARTCGVTSAGYIRCWGNTVNAPVRSDTDGYMEVAVSRGFTCGRRSNGAVDCWSNITGAIPTPPTVQSGDRAGEPVTFSTISAGQSHVCGILDGQHSQTAGLLQCWPLPDSEAGVKLATVPDELAAVTFGAVDAGLFGTCAPVKDGTDDGKAKCWGGTDQTAVKAELPDTVFADISTTGWGACAIVRSGDEAGQVKCWGTDFADEIDGAPETGTFSSLDMGVQHACALKTDGVAVCWGADGDADTAGIQIATRGNLIRNTGQADPQPPAPGVAMPVVTLALSETSISENGGSSAVTATLDTASVAATTIRVSMSSLDPEFVTVSGNTLTIPPGMMSSIGTCIITAVDNNRDEPDRKLTVSGRAAEGIEDRATISTILTITDDDQAQQATSTPTPTPQPTRTSTPTPTFASTSTPQPTFVPIPQPTLLPTSTPDIAATLAVMLANHRPSNCRPAHSGGYASADTHYAAARGRPGNLPNPHATRQPTPTLPHRRPAGSLNRPATVRRGYG